MKYFYSLSAALLTPTIALIQPYITFAALSATDIDKIATAITVKIVDVANPGDSGSGVIIKQTGNTYTVLTAFHVVQNGAKNLVTPDEQIYRLKNVKPLPDKVDLAIAEFSSNQKYTVAKIGNSDAAVRTTTVYVAGFPSPSGGIKNPDLFINTGTVNANGRAQSEGYNIFYSNDTLRGMSGGAVLNDKGELVAIHGRVRADEVEEKSQSKAIFGYGITIYSALRQMAKVGIDVGVKPPDVVTTALKPDDFLIKGNEKYDQKDWRGALADYNQAIKLDSNYAIAYMNRGNVRDDLGDKQGAITDYNQAIKINPNYAKAYYNRGNVRDDLGDKQGAITDYNQAIKINPNYAKAYSNRGIVRDDLGDKQGAIADYNQAIKINPNLAQAYYNRGVVRKQLGDKQGAIQDVQKAGELFKQQGDNANYERAMKLLELIKNQR
jgi:tetratricopeptide (TPR) repeat protein